MKAIVLVAHGWNIGWLGPYGNEWISTPALDQLAADGIVFDQHFAVCPSPEAVTQGFFSSRFGFTDSTVSQKSWFDALRSAGVGTSLVLDLRWESPTESVGDWDRIVKLGEGGPATLTDAIREVIASGGHNHELLWVETDWLLPPWVIDQELFDEYAMPELSDESARSETSSAPWADPPFGPLPSKDIETWERLQNSFAAVVTAFDEEIAELMQTLGNRDDRLLMVTSSFGLPLGEHGSIGWEDASPHEALIHLPLLVQIPSGAEKGRRVGEFTQSLDLGPTLLELFGLPVLENLHGQSLLPRLHGKSGPKREYAVSGVGPWRAIRMPEWAALFGPDSVGKLYRKPDDRWEVNDACHQHDKWCEYLAAFVKEFDAATLQEGTPSLPELKTYEAIAGRSVDAPEGAEEAK